MNTTRMSTGIEIGKEGGGVIPPSDSQKRQIDTEIRDSVGVHWLRGSVEKMALSGLVAVLDDLFGDHDEREYGLYCYDRQYFWPTVSASLNYHSTKDRYRLSADKITFEIPGGGFDKLGPDGLCPFLDLVASFKPQISRMDVYFDDSQRVITPRKLADLVYEVDEDGNVLRRDFAYLRKIEPRMIGGLDGLEYDSCNFGSRKRSNGGVYLRCYDKDLESKGENPAVRWEAEFSGCKAHKAFMGLIGFDGDLERVAGAIGCLVGGSVDFLKRTERSGDKNLDRLERYDFWQNILDRIGHSRIQVKRSKMKVEKTFEWLHRSVVPAIRMCRVATGEQEFFEWLLDVIDDDSRLKTIHYEAIAEFKDRMKADGFHVREMFDYFYKKGLQHDLDFMDDLAPHRKCAIGE